MAVNIVTVTAFTVPGTFNTSVSRLRNLNVNQLKEVDDITVSAQPAIKAIVLTPSGKIYTNETAAAIKALANA